MTSPAEQPYGVNSVLQDTPNPRPTPDVFSLSGRIAVITGGHRSIGLEIALIYAQAGGIVHCLDLPKEPDSNFRKVQQSVVAASQSTNSKERIEYGSCDVTEQKEVWAVMERISEEGRLDVCVACAGILRTGEMLDYDLDDFQNLMKVNVNGVLFTAQGADRVMVKNNTPGSIIVITSMSGSVADENMHWVAYNTSKASVIQMTRSFACELGPKKIRCNSISLGYVYTEMTKTFLNDDPRLKDDWCSQNPLGGLANPEELCGAALFLGGDASTFCTGSNIIVDGGHRAW